MADIATINGVAEDNVAIVNSAADDTLTTGNGLTWAHSYEIDGSGLWAASGTNYLEEVFTTASPNKRKFTVSAWVKPSTFATRQVIFDAEAPTGTSYGLYCRMHTDGRLQIHYDGTSSGTSKTSAVVMSSTSRYYHIVVAFDTTQATAANRNRIYVDGSEVTVVNGADGGTGVMPVRNLDTDWGHANTEFKIGLRAVDNDLPWRGNIASIAVLDNQQLAASDFAKTVASVWTPKDLSGLTFNNNSFWIEGGVDMIAGTDSSGNGFSFVKTGTITNDSTDSPTN